MEINLTQCQLRYLDNEAPLFSNLNLHLPKGKWSCILGKSGCGKTSLLRLLAGLLDSQATWHGQLTTDNDTVLSEQVAYMAQQDLLLPWLSVLENVCLSLRFNQVQTDKAAQDKAHQLLVLVGLSEYIHARPNQLSGGMRQRVALARTLMQDKPVVLMDEPFSALDAVTRHKLQTLSAKLLKGKTVLLITHDPQEALRLGDQLLLMSSANARSDKKAASQIVTLPVPQTVPPRDFSAELAEHHQQIIERLEQDYA
ncbi:hydrogenase expression protein [Photobacterium jeanii]|uniref:Hydrogenase expression protein n=1 Tax=Photobacterium jeanii TaxID=858640 RepID=A0A178K3N6_9GAMM|nr:ABC transporter ATP-binding protein [Photobacterium jeanii]OAN11717.1 hydrogenase expression protein [Photobacterium jeanii]